MLSEFKISIVVPVWNEEKYLEQSLNSIKKQIFRNYEVIIVNDCSTDRSSDIIKSFVESDPRFCSYSTSKNSGGPSEPLNIGFSHARGQYYTWLSGDSWMEPECLGVLLSVLEENPKIVMVYSDYYYVDDISHQTLAIQTPEFDRKALWRQCNTGPTWLFRAKTKKKAGDYCKQICEDYYMHLRLSNFGDFKRVPKLLGAWRNHNKNLSNRVNNKSHWHFAITAAAKAKWQSAKYRIAYVCPAFDCAAVGWLLNVVINHLSDDFAMRYIIKVKKPYVESGQDLMFGCDDDEIASVLKECDIIHFQNFLDRFAGKFDLFEWIKKKPTVLHMLGGIDQWDIHRLNSFIKEFNCSSIGCTPGHPTIPWIPCVIPISGQDPPLYYEEYYRPAKNWPRTDPKVKFLCHHNYMPGKGVDQIQQMFEMIKKTNSGQPIGHCPVGYKQNFELGVAKMEYSIGSTTQFINLFDHLNFKKGFDVCIDQITQAFVGMTAWESLAQGAAVIGRLDSLTMKAYKELWGEPPPILNSRIIDDIAVYVRRLACNKSYVNDVGCKGHNWIMKHYTAPRLLPLYEEVYLKTIRKK